MIKWKSNGSSRQAAANQTEKKSDPQKSTYIKKSNVVGEDAADEARMEERKKIEIGRPLLRSTKRTSSQTPSSSTNYASNHTGSEPLRRNRVSFAAGKSYDAADAEMGGSLTFLPADDAAGDSAVPK